MAAPRSGQVVFATSGYVTDQGTHGGYPAVDAFAPRHTPIYAPYAGRSEPAWYSLGGNACWFYPDAGSPGPKVWYLAHGAQPFLAGRFSQGQQIGAVGNSGNASGTAPHVHYAGGVSAQEISARNGSGSFWFEPWSWGQGAAVGKPRYRVKVDGLRLRVLPLTGDASPTLKELPAGTIVTAHTDESYAWRLVVTPDGLAGFVADAPDFLEEV